MISHPSEWTENYTPGADTTSKADYRGLTPVEALQHGWDRVLAALGDDQDEFVPDECNGSGHCKVGTHVHGCFSDMGQCDEPMEHGVAA